MILNPAKVFENLTANIRVSQGLDLKVGNCFCKQFQGGGAGIIIIPFWQNENDSVRAELILLGTTWIGFPFQSHSGMGEMILGKVILEASPEK